MIDEPVSVEDLLHAWRDAIRAAELAERLTRIAVQTADDADLRFEAAREIATLAGKAAEYAARAGERAAIAASEAAVLAAALRDQGVAGAQATQRAAQKDEAAAALDYHDAADQDLVG